jgi:uncharacterized membrane protein YcaP (DUF421 family)
MGEILGASWTTIGATVIATLAIYAVVIAATRLAGLRSFAKMSAFDFAATIATGSILASAALGQASLVTGIVAVAVLFTAQALVAVTRRQRWLHRVTDNSPLLLMDGPDFLEDNMRKAHVTQGDVMAKLRAANVTRMEQVRCVVLETTGDVSVLHRAPGEGPVDDALLRDVMR